MKLRPNAVSWNPMEAFTFTAANEDYKYNQLSYFFSLLLLSINYFGF